MALSVVVLLGGSLLCETANAANCAALEMRVMQLQARSNPNQAELSEARNLLGMCNGTQTASALPWGSKPKAERGEGRATPNTVRTLCVRTCDGYYFPISFSTTKKYFETDEATCQRLCPAGDASLYYHSRRQGPEQMVSIAGTPYTDLENAFRYRTVLDRSCTCGTPLPISEPAEIVLADYSDEPATPSASEEDSQTLTSLLSTPTFTASVISNAPTEAPIALQPDSATPLPTRIILATGSAEQDRLVVPSAPEKWFQEDPGVSYLHGPGDIACLSRGPACRAQ